MEDSTKVNLEDLHKSEDFCEWLKKQKVGDLEVVVKAFGEEQIGGPAFLDLTEQDFKEMGLKIGHRKDLLRLQKEHKPDQTEVSENNYDLFDYNTKYRVNVQFGHNITITS